MRSLPQKNNRRTLLHETSINNSKPLYTKAELTKFYEAAKQKKCIFLDCKSYAEIEQIDEKQYIVIRVDIDDEFLKTEKLAELLHSLNIPATFFFRMHTSHYNLHEKECSRILKRIAGMGFEIGMHSENIFLAHDYNLDPVQAFKDSLSELEFLAGQKIYGSACHGEPWYYEKGLNNLDFWKANFPKDFGLLYEAYDQETFGLFQNGLYISDSDLSSWKAYDSGKLIKGDQRSPTEHLQETDKDIYLLLHPDLYEDS